MPNSKAKEVRIKHMKRRKKQKAKRKQEMAKAKNPPKHKPGPSNVLIHEGSQRRVEK